MKKLFFIFLVNIFLSNIVFAQDFSKEIVQNFDNPKALGSYSLRVWGFHIYEISTIAQDLKNYRDKFAICIKYNRNFSKEELVEASIDEILRIKEIDENKAKIYRKYLNKIFTDVKIGDRKTAIIDKNGLQLYHNSVLIDSVKDADFALDFADIWLHEKAKYKKMRNELLKL